MSNLSLFGLFSVTAMMVCYALERRHRVFMLAFSAACILTIVRHPPGPTDPLTLFQSLGSKMANLGSQLWFNSDLRSWVDVYAAGRDRRSPCSYPGLQTVGAILLLKGETFKSCSRANGQPLRRTE